MASRISGKAYLQTWIGLLVLTAVSFTAAHFELGLLDTPIMLGIATVKSLLVVMIFMHLAEARFASRMVALVSALFVVLLVTLTAADVVTRDPLPPVTEPPMPEPTPPSPAVQPAVPALPAPPPAVQE